MDIIILIAIAILGLVYTGLFKANLNKKELMNLKKLWLYHLIFGIYVALFIGTDAMGYWRLAKIISWEDFLFNIFNSKGTFFMYAIHYFPSNYLGLSYFSGTMIYTFIGFIGISCFYVLTVKIIPRNSNFKGLKLFPLLFFFPNLHFWSVAAGKDTLMFFAIGVFCYSLYYKKYIPVIISLLLAYMVRPHVVLFLIVAFGLVYSYASNISVFKRALFSIVLLGVGIAILPTVMEYAKIEEVSIEELTQFAENKAVLLSRAHTGSGVDISGYPLPLKIFTFLYRPFFFDINGIPAVLASFENLLLLLLSIKVFRNKPIKMFKSSPLLIKGLVFFLIIGTLAFSQTLGNVGIMLRMRNMFLPGMMLFILWAMSYQEKKHFK